MRTINKITFLFWLLLLVGCGGERQERPQITKTIVQKHQEAKTRLYYNVFFERVMPTVRTYYYLYADDNTYIEVNKNLYIGTVIGGKVKSNRWRKR